MSPRLMNPGHGYLQELDPSHRLPHLRPCQELWCLELLLIPEHFFPAVQAPRRPSVEGVAERPLSVGQPRRLLTMPLKR